MTINCGRHDKWSIMAEEYVVRAPGLEKMHTLKNV